MTAEFCRRAERGLGVAIREGQANGTIETRSDVARRGTMVRERNQGRISDDDLNHFMNEVDTKQKLADLVDTQELSNNGCGIYQMTDNVTDEQFDQAIAEAKSEGNLSRANVARKCKAKSKPVIDAEGTVAILAAILAGTPRLPGAACRDHVGLYDAAADGDRDAAQEAVDICRRCPVLDACERWAERAYPQKKPAGVLARPIRSTHQYAKGTNRMTINTTSPNAVDYLKYAQAEGDSLLVYAADALAQLPVDGHPEIESAIDTVQSVLDAARHMLAEAAAAFCRDGKDMDTYADGRPVRSRLDFEPGVYYEHVWHPWVEHRINRPQRLGGAVTTTGGQRKQLFISAPGVLDSVDARPGLRLAADDGSGQ